MTEEKLISKIYIDRFLSKISVFIYFISVYNGYIARTTENYFVWMIGSLILAIYFQYKANVNEKILKEISNIESPEEEHKLTKLIREKRESMESKKENKK